MDLLRFVKYYTASIDNNLNFDGQSGWLPDQALKITRKRYARLTGGECRPQPAALYFDAATFPASQERSGWGRGNPANFRSLNPYFPITNMLSEPEIERFYELVQSILQNPLFDIQLTGEHRADLTTELPQSSICLVAGHLAETFFFRPQILERLLAAGPRFQLYATTRAFTQDGGKAGGDFNPERRSLQLVLSRLFEGFNGPTPGVCPFLHELGHLLDHFDLSTGKIERSSGLLPGLSPEDGEFFLPHARRAFIAGKTLELERYLAVSRGVVKPRDPLPIGHPYVFQNDTEFIAGYFEMFFRSPHYFSNLNPRLYSAFSELFAYDPRRAWQTDFPFYIEQNRAFYLSGQKPPEPGITIPGA